MPIGAKDIKLYVWKFLEFSVKTASLFARKYPLPSGVLFFSFLLYLLSPFIFKLLLYSVPILACAAAGVSRYLSSSSAIAKINNLKVDREADHRDFPLSKSESSLDGVPIHRSKKPPISSQMSKGHNFKANREDLNPQGSTDAIPADESFIGKAKKIEETENPIIGELEIGECSQVECSRKSEISEERALELGEVEPQKAEDWTSQIETDLEEAEDDDDEDDEEEDHAQEDGNRVLEWTEDDQKNVMDMGFSELERNRRLENLIAKRQAWKLTTPALRVPTNLLDLSSNVPSSHVPHVQITKEEEDMMGDSQIPGSAPSVMFPARNPFNIPYNPLEKKPNLMTDESNQELSGVSQSRDIFCRHESFTLGPSFFPEIYQDNGLHGTSKSRFPRFRRLANKGDHDRLINQILYQERNSTSQDENKSPGEMSKAPEKNMENGVCAEEHLGDDSRTSKDAESNIAPQNEVLLKPEEEDAESNSSAASAELEEKMISKERQDTSEMARVDSLPEEHSSPGEGSLNAGGLSTRNEHFSGLDNRPVTEYVDRGMGHNTTFSIASDMQVEVSDTGSPRNTPDGIMSPPDVIEEDELRLKEINDADHRQQQQEVAASLGIFIMNNHNTDPSASTVSTRNVDKEDSADKISTSNTTNPEEGHSEHQVCYHENTYTDKETRETKPGSPDSSEAEILEEEIQFIDNSAPQEVHSREPEDISSLPGSSSVKTEYNRDEVLQSSNVDENSSRTTQHIADEIRNQMEQDVIPQSEKLDEEDTNPFASPMEEASMTYTTIDPTAQREGDGHINSQFAEGLEGGGSKTQPKEDKSPGNDTPSN